jgi:hypothetical protein
MPSADDTVQPETCDVPVNVCTYNRHQLLREALESIVGNEIVFTATSVVDV